MKKLYLFFACSMILGFAIGQKKIVRCYSQEHLQHQIKQDPERGSRLEALDNRVDEIIANKSGAAAKGKPGGTPRSVVYIPVVVNVVFRTTAENISDAQIQSQIDVLNKDFTATNKEVLNSGSYNFAGYFSLVADCKIQFCLNKVVRKATTVTAFNPNDDGVKKTAMGGQDPLNPETMLNLWSCNMVGGILGYAQFPGGKAPTDGVVILYGAFGTSAGGATEAPYDEGRTATHEIGHWLGLRHIWGDRQCGNDFVKDTPEQDGPNFDCPAPGLTSTCKRPVLEQYMNYMDYVVDLCMYMFTKGQLSRMDGYIAASRAPYCLNACPAPALTKTANPQNRIAASLAGQQLLVYPTITGDLTNLVIPSKSGGRGDIVLLSQSGAIVKRQRVVLTSGNTYFKLNMGDLPNGIYLIKVVNADGRSETQKLVVQH